jgi:glucokinase
MNEYVYGIDIGGTNIKLGLFTLPDMQLIAVKEIETPRLNQETSIFEQIGLVISEMNQVNGIEFKQVKGVGAAVPCPVKNGHVDKCPNLKWNKLDIIFAFNKVLPDHVRVAVSNDATLAAYGENQVLEKPFKNAVFYTLGTGVGGGIIINGEILEGATGLGGEIGHMRVFDEATETCGCGSQGCLEQICGTSGILNYAKKLSLSSASSIDFKNLSVKSVFDAAKTGDKVGLQVINRVAEYIAISASIIAVILDPDVFIIGGGISKAGSFLVDLISQHYQKHARFSSYNIPFLLATTGNDAGIIGAAYLIRKQI